MDETPYRMEPLLPSEETSADLYRLAREAIAADRTLRAAVDPAQAAEARRAVICAEAHFSNLIELHYVDPADIALLSSDPRHGGDGPLVREAAAHLEAQRTIAAASLGRPTSQSFLRFAHASFVDALPPSIRFLRPNSSKILRAGEYRRGPDEHASVGGHEAPSPDAVPVFMSSYEERYAGIYRSPEAILSATPAAHHRFLFVHPFQDGNGRTSRFLLQALFRHAGADGGGLWSPSRMCATAFEGIDGYTRTLAYAETPRRGDRDGRGNLSQDALDAFCRGFLAAAAQEMRFMTRLLSSPWTFDGLIADPALFPPPLPPEDMDEPPPGPDEP